MKTRLSGPAERKAQARLEALAREDKWYLSAGDGVLWAPPFPRSLHRPGFWDPARVYEFATPPVFAVALVDAEGAGDPLTAEGSDWRPDRLRTRWRSRSGLLLTEFRYLLPGGRLCSAWRTEEELGWPNPAFRALTLLAFTAMPAERARDIRPEGSGIRWTLSLLDEEVGLHVDVHLTAELLPPRGRHTVARDVGEHLARVRASILRGAMRSEGGVDADWDRTPFAECWADCEAGRLEAGAFPDNGETGGHTHLVTALPLRDVPARYGIAFIAKLVPLGDHAPPRHRPTPAAPPMPRRAEARWREMLASYPRFECGQPHLARAFDYHLYASFLARLEGGVGRIRRPALTAGIDRFHLPRASSTTSLVRDARWCTDPGTAFGSLLNFLDAQGEDGSIPARLCIGDGPTEGIEHANWGDALLALDELHPRGDVLSVAYGALSRYADWLRSQRDPEGGGLITLLVRDQAPWRWSPRFAPRHRRDDATDMPSPVKGVEATVYAYQLFSALGGLARRLGRENEAESWEAIAGVTGNAMLREMWAPDLGLFTDLDAATGRRTGVKSVVGFYPLLTDLLDPGHVEALLAHLANPSTFGTPFPLPSCSADDPRFSPEGIWMGVRRGAPWNGRVSPHANCHVVEGLLRHWLRGTVAAGRPAAELLAGFVRMMFHQDDPRRPNCYEHYNPITGHPSVFRGIDDHRQVWVVDLLARGVAGVHPTAEALVIHPLPMDLDRVGFRGRLRGVDVRVSTVGDDVRASVGGAAYQGRVGTPLRIPW